jgi:hypothetical protein
VLNLTNHEADHLARHAEQAAGLLRELAAHHRSQQDAMHVIGERLMEWYHEGKRTVILEVVEQVEKDAADLRARRKPVIPGRTAELPTVRPVSTLRPAMSEHHRRLAIEEANTPR